MDQRRSEAHARNAGLEASAELKEVLAHAETSQLKIAKARIDKKEEKESRLASVERGGVRLPPDVWR